MFSARLNGFDLLGLIGNLDVNFIFQKSRRSVPVSEWLALLTSDHETLGSNRGKGGIHLMTVRHLVPFHHLDMTYIMLKKTLNNKQIPQGIYVPRLIFMELLKRSKLTRGPLILYHLPKY